MNRDKENKMLLMLGFVLVIVVAAAISVNYGTDALILFFIIVFAATSYAIITMLAKDRVNEIVERRLRENQRETRQHVDTAMAKIVFDMAKFKKEIRKETQKKTKSKK